MKQWLATKTVLLGLLFSSLSLSAQESTKISPRTLAFGPEIYSVQRKKEEGASQQGVMYGLRINLDHIKRHRFYWGFEGLWARGCLTGKLKSENSSGSEKHIAVKSHLMDANFEERLGFTFQMKNCYCLTFTPYIGLGYFWEYNHYKRPKSSAFHFNNEFLYVPVGFLSQIFVAPDLSVGLNFKVRILIHGSQRVTNDSEYADHDMNYDEKVQYRGELPISYYFKWNCQSVGLNLTPFCEFREYGARINFPQDFHRTHYQLYGAAAKFLVLF